MNRFKNFVLLLILIFTATVYPVTTQAQQGIPYTSNFQIPDNIKGRTLQITEDDKGTIYLLNNKGLYTFDGFQWDIVFKGERPLSFAINKHIIISTEKGLYFINRETSKPQTVQPITDTTYDYYHKLIHSQEKIIAIGTQTVSEIDVSNEAKATPIYSINDSTQILTDAFYIGKNLFIVSNQSSIHKVESTKATRIKMPKELNNVNILFPSQQGVFIADSKGNLFEFNGNQFKRIGISDQDFVKESIITAGIAINEQTIALSTQLGGCIVINIKTGKTKHVLNYETGLPDDEIQTVGKDVNGGLWIAHGMGISRVDLSLPIETINHIRGLSGYILSATNSNGSYYVGTSEGLFVLEEQKTFKEITVKRTPKTEKSAEPAAVQTPQNEKQTETEQPNAKKKRFFGRLWQKITSSEAVNEKDTTPPSLNPAALTQSKTEKPEKAQHKKVLKLQSVEYFYKKIEPLNGKCTHLLLFNNQLLAGTSTGLYLVSGGTAKTVLPSTQINAIRITKSNGIIVSANSSLYAISSTYQSNHIHNFGNEQIKSIAEHNDKSLIITTETKVYYVKANNGKPPFISSYELPATEHNTPIAFNIGNTAYLLLTGDIYQLTNNDTFKRDTSITKKAVTSIIAGQTDAWLHTQNGWIHKSATNEKLGNAAPLIGLFDKITSIYSSSKQLVLVSNNSQIVLIQNPTQSHIASNLPLFIKQILDYNGALLHPNHISLSKEQSAITIRVSAPFFLKEQSTQFQFIIEGLMRRWSDWNTTPAIELPYLPSGEYTIKVRARDALQRESNIIPLSIYIQPQFWETPWFIALCILFIAIAVFILMKLRERQLRIERDLLEKKVKERTATIVKQNQELNLQKDELAIQNKEILQQKEEIETQRDEIELQRDQIVKQNEEITQSIVYAKRIQTAAMPKKDSISKLLPEHFVLFMPRDIVSGDFYWTAQKGCKTIIAAADCTGHGVPGAFMSMLGLSFLNDIVTRNQETQPALILNTLREYIKTTLAQKGTEGDNKDGMDIAICVIDYCEQTIEFAGAYNPLYYIQNGIFNEIKGDKMPVGIHVKEKAVFTNHTITSKGIDMIYLFSDGFVDQFGGERNSKFMSKRFKELLTNIHKMPVKEQHRVLKESFDKWKGDNDQVDDVLIFGIRISDTRE
ncbi:MAG: SpoIIE family protein phosphatase [Bacteroidales bacterium]|nr:SpoIIE family protein phosphatase [Bacteroidales bacterium]MBN2750255.1 SpoIIE family protein phosphatase [Bacteroidales bacterium]